MSIAELGWCHPKTDDSRTTRRETADVVAMDSKAGDMIDEVEQRGADGEKREIDQDRPMRNDGRRRPTGWRLTQRISWRAIGEELVQWLADAGAGAVGAGAIAVARIAGVVATAAGSVAMAAAALLTVGTSCAIRE